MKSHLRIAQLEFQLEGGSGTVIAAEGQGSAAVSKAFGVLGSALAGQPIDWLSEGRLPNVVTHAPAPRARRCDPQTSHDAAARAIATATAQREKIVAVIVAAGDRGACAREIERRTGLTVVQINRRMLEIDGIERRLREGADSERDFQRREGCAIWWAKS